MKQFSMKQFSMKHPAMIGNLPKSTPRLILCSILCALTIACDDGDDTSPGTLAGEMVNGGNEPAGMDLAGMDLAGMDVAGTDLAGEMVNGGNEPAGTNVAGMNLAGMDLAGEMVNGGNELAGTDVAGTDLAGEMVNGGNELAGTEMGGSTGPVDCSAATADQPCVVSIYDARRVDVTADLTPVQVEGVVTAVRINNDSAASHITLQDPAGGEYSGIWVYLNDSDLDALPIFNRGEIVRISGLVDNFFGQRQINSVTQVELLGAGPAIAPMMVSPVEISTDGASASALEGVLVQVTSVTVQEVNPMAGPGDSDPNSEFVVDGGLRVDDYIHQYELPMVGDSFTSITGVLRFGNDDSKVIPRDAADLAR